MSIKVKYFTSDGPTVIMRLSFLATDNGMDIFIDISGTRGDIFLLSFEKSVALLDTYEHLHEVSISINLHR